MIRHVDIAQYCSPRVTLVPLSMEAPQPMYLISWRRPTGSTHSPSDPMPKVAKGYFVTSAFRDNLRHRILSVLYLEMYEGVVYSVSCHARITDVVDDGNGRSAMYWISEGPITYKRLYETSDARQPIGAGAPQAQLHEENPPSDGEGAGDMPEDVHKADRLSSILDQNPGLAPLFAVVLSTIDAANETAAAQGARVVKKDVRMSEHSYGNPVRSTASLELGFKHEVHMDPVSDARGDVEMDENAE